MKERLNKWIEKHDLRTKYKKYLVIAYIVLVMAPIMLAIGIRDRGVDNLLVKMVATVLLLLLFVVFFVYDYRKKLAQYSKFYDSVSELSKKVKWSGLRIPVLKEPVFEIGRDELMNDLLQKLWQN